jgi:hypothetical protein
MLWSAVACSDEVVSSAQECVADREHSLDCGEDYDGFYCKTDARPDGDPKYLDGVPQGSVCAERGARGDDGRQGYCCTPRVTACAFNPVAICDESNVGFQCRGANRPDAINAALSCGNGVEQGDFVNYCCTGTTQEPGCLQSDSLSCSSRLMGFSCRGDNLPRGEQLGANKSRSDFYRLLCSAPKVAANAEYKNYCCYPPAPLPEGGSCVAHTNVPGCEAGRFGFACYGPDRPEDNYAPMHCPAPGKAGLSAENYPATLYCCDFE